MVLAQDSKIGSSILHADQYPEYIKYMGSKSKIMDFVVSGINQVYSDGPICDLFAGSCSLAGALGKQVAILSNDIQAYSSVLAHAYLTSWRDEGNFVSGEDIADKASQLVSGHSLKLPSDLSYHGSNTIEEFNQIDERNRALIEESYDFKWHLFTKCYSGTWWSAEQCLWIDALRQVADEFSTTSYYNVILASLMHAMTYSSHGTGHYAHYRNAKTLSAMEDIVIYRQRSLRDYFVRKYNSITEALASTPPILEHEITAFDYTKRLSNLPKCTVYADPPYCFVHYSRFYHALETLVLYDFPKIQIRGGEMVKGRYRESRHQSPFCIQSQVHKAFKKLFRGVSKKESNLVLSYSNTGVIGMEELTAMAEKSFGTKYEISVLSRDHLHMTMGRRDDRDRSVQESLILARRK